jgi:predicted nuclease of predicted toxin-antitoxin system
LVRRLSDLFPDSSQTRLLGFERSSDLLVWNHARANGFSVVTLDKDFADIALLRGAPPKVIWLRCGNSTVAKVEHLLRENLGAISAFGVDPDSVVLEVWP